MPMFGQLNHSLRILVLQDSEYLHIDNSASLTVTVKEMTAVAVNINNFVLSHPNRDVAFEASGNKDLQIL